MTGADLGELPPPPDTARSAGPHRWSARISNVLAVMVATSLFLGLTLIWVERAVFDDEQFANRATRLLQSSEVREALATEIVDEIIQNGGSQLIPYRTVVISVGADLASTAPFQAIFRQAVLQAHRTVFTEDGSSVAVNLTGAIGILTSSLQISNPDIAAKIPSDLSQIIIDGTDQVRQLELWQSAEELTSLAESLLLFSAVGSLAVVYLASNRRIGVLKVGVSLMAAGIGVIAVALVVPRLVASRIPDPSFQGAVEIALTDFVSDLRSLGTWSVAFGVIAAALSTASTPNRPAVTPRELWERAHQTFAAWAPTTPLGQGARATTIIAVGLAIVVWRDTVVPLAAVGVGAFVAYFGLIQLLAVVGRPPLESATGGGGPVVAGDGGTPAGSLAATRWRRQRLIWVSATGVALFVVVGVVGWVHFRAAERQAAAAAPPVCNGSEDLCDKPIDQVAFAASHNSMSAAADSGWLFAQNRYGIADQLEWGVRGLLVKTHYGIPTGITLTGSDIVVTDRAAEVNANPQGVAGELPDGAAARAQQLAASANVDPSQRDVYLCHVYCELGSQLFTDALAEIQAFLDRNPSEVIFFVSGDYVSGDDTAARFAAAGLADRLWEYDPSRPPPTLQQMIDADKQIFYLAENSRTPPAWNNPAYGPDGIFQDTPFTFTDPSQLEGDQIQASCAANRGTAASPLFQVNHWITNADPPSIDVAKTVNAYEVLMPRVKGCQSERGRFPTLIGVNYYDQGDLLKVVDELNGVDDPGVR
jgi:hypothetical protein